jgi:hypothetical protein
VCTAADHLRAEKKYRIDACPTRANVPADETVQARWPFTRDAGGTGSFRPAARAASTESVRPKGTKMLQNKTILSKLSPECVIVPFRSISELVKYHVAAVLKRDR